MGNTGVLLEPHPDAWVVEGHVVVRDDVELAAKRVEVPWRCGPVAIVRSHAARMRLPEHPAFEEVRPSIQAADDANDGSKSKNVRRS